MKTTVEEFRRQIAETGAYRTPREGRPVARRRPGALTTLSFSLAATRVFPLSALWDAVGKLTTGVWNRFCFGTVEVAERCGMEVVVDGWQTRAAYKGPVVYLCNHMSAYETCLLPPIMNIYTPLRIIVKASLSHLPFLKHAAAIMGLVPVGRKDPKADLLYLYERGVRHLKDGESFLIFPQGTRQEVFEKRHFSSIGAKLAEKAGVPVVPVVVDTRCMPTRKSGFLKRFFKDFGPVDTSRDVRCEAGPVIPPGKSRVMNDAAFDWMASKLEEWGLPVDRG